MEKKKLNILTLADDTILQLWLIDRIACGMGYEYINAEYQLTFNNNFNEDDFELFKDKYFEQIEKRKDEMQFQIKESNIVGKTMKIMELMYENLMTNDSNPREFAALANSLQGYIDSVKKINTKEIKQVTNNNYLILEGLEREGYISIIDRLKLKEIIDVKGK